MCSVERGRPYLPHSWVHYDRQSFFNAHVRNCLISTSGMKCDVAIMFFDPDFLYDAGIPAIREHYSKNLHIYIWMDFQDLLARGRVVRCWFPTNSFLFLGYQFSFIMFAVLFGNKSSAVAQMGDRGHNRHGLKKTGGCCDPFAGAGTPSTILPHMVWP